MDYIRIKGASQHNLKNLNLDLPRNKFIVITGPSGSGKSSLAFNTLWTEGQRRYIECLSTYARQFVENLEKPNVELIEGISPAIAINQKTISTNPRSTVGTVTEIHDYLRLLFAKVGIPHCPVCKREVSKQSPVMIWERIRENFQGRTISILATIVRGKKGDHRELLEKFSRKGFIKARIDGNILELTDSIYLDKNKKHTIEIFIDQLTINPVREGRAQEALNLALKIGNGTVTIIEKDGREHLFSTKLYCPNCDIDLPEFEPRSFSFNSPYGACKRCEGLGWLSTYDEWGELVLTDEICPVCNGRRLKEESLSVLFLGKNIHHYSTIPVSELRRSLDLNSLEKKERLIAERIIKEINSRLDVMLRLGLGYLDLNRPTSTLSGGEAQRVRLASTIGSRLRGVLYVLDEPSIGLHNRDNTKLIRILQEIRDLGNTVIVVEHDEDTIRSADWIIDLGPEGGEKGGYLVAQGDLSTILKSDSITASYLRKDKIIPIPTKRRKPKGFIEIIGAQEHNLKNINVKIPLGVFVCVTGVSGSGKSTLVFDILYKAASNFLYKSKEKPGKFKEIRGLENIDKVINVDQSPIGRTPRSNPATYTEIFGTIRKLFAMTQEARARGYREGRFSFNVKGGRCEACLGAGVRKIEMNFLPDVYVKCDRCGGKRYNKETLEIRYKGKNIYEYLEMTVDEAYEYFKNIPFLKRRLDVMRGVGLGYIKLGQPAPTLSGGEAQRVKLCKELGRKSTGKTLYILDEPTTGLHLDDIKKLINVLTELVERGNTVIVIEHNLEVIKSADWIIDLGPEGGDDGGYLVAEGTPEEISRMDKSFTGIALRKVMDGRRWG
jgi:excinuclease ABC subunit A